MDKIGEKEWSDFERMVSDLVDKKEVRVIITLLNASSIRKMTYTEVERMVSDLVDKKEVTKLLGYMTPKSSKPLDKTITTT